MKCIYSLSLILLFMSNRVLCQEVKSFSNIFVGASYTYIWDNEIDSVNPNGKIDFSEQTYRLKITTNVGYHWRLGLDGRLIRFHPFYTNPSNAYMAGALLQYGFYLGDYSRFVLELGLKSGNYCTCGDGASFLKNNLLHLGYGWGFDFKIWHSVFMDLGWQRYYILNKLPKKYSYTQYIIGLKYQFPVPEVNR